MLRTDRRETVISAPEKMTVAQLVARTREHESTAAMFDNHGEPTMARKFRELAATYREELERRSGVQPKPAVEPSEPTPAPPLPPLIVELEQPEHCTKCKGSGRMFDNSYCVCKLGWDLWNLETYRPGGASQ